MKAINLQGWRFDRLVAIERVESGTNGVLWRLRCDCGDDVYRTTANILAKMRTGVRQSCEACRGKPR